MPRKSRAKPPSPFKGFNSSPEVVRLVVLMYVRFPLSLRNVEDLLFERGYFDVAQARGEAEIEQDRQPDRLGREAVALEGNRLHVRLTRRPDAAVGDKLAFA